MIKLNKKIFTRKFFRELLEHPYFAPVSVSLILFARQFQMSGPRSKIRKYFETKEIDGKKNLPDNLKTLIAEELEAHGLTSNESYEDSKAGLLEEAASLFYVSKYPDPAIYSHTTGAAIGLPANFAEKVSVDKSSNLSEEAKRFWVRRNLAFKDATYGYVAGDILFAYFCTFGIYYIDLTIKENLRRRRWSTVALRAAVVGISLVLYAYGRSSLYRKAELKADRKTIIESEKYVRGGVEFYHNVLETNKSLKNFGNYKWKNRFDSDGDYNSVIRAFNIFGIPECSIVERLRQIDSMLENE